MSNKNFFLVITLIVMSLTAFPIWQGLQTNGYLFYTNGIDESGYLNYSTAKATWDLSKFGRASIYLVLLGHELGLSGGWLNLIFDVVSILMFLVLANVFLKKLQFKHPAVLGICAICLPLIFLNFNPLVNWIFNYNISYGGLAWFSMPWSFTPPMSRSPEPQISFVILLLAMQLGLTWRSYLPIYCVLPFLYYFLAVPVAFVVLTLHIRSYLKDSLITKISAPVAAYVLISFGQWICYALLAAPDVQDNILLSRWPLLSYSSLLALAFYFIDYNRFEPKYRYPLILLACGGLAVENTQLINGMIMHAHNFEQYYGVTAISFILGYGLLTRYDPRLVTLIVLVPLFLWSYGSFTENRDSFQRISFTPELKRALVEDPTLVAINSLYATSLLDLTYARQKCTAFSYYGHNHDVGSYSLDEYACYRNQVLENVEYREKFTAVIEALDKQYIWPHAHYSLVNLGRVQSTAPREINFAPRNCNKTLKIFLLKAK